MYSFTKVPQFPHFLHPLVCFYITQNNSLYTFKHSQRQQQKKKLEKKIAALELLSYAQRKTVYVLVKCRSKYVFILLILYGIPRNNKKNRNEKKFSIVTLFPFSIRQHPKKTSYKTLRLTIFVSSTLYTQNQCVHSQNNALC